MKTINIAGVSCNVERLATLTYEQLLKSARSHPKWQGVKDADKIIDKELRENGFKPASKNRKPSKADKSNKNRANASRRTSNKRRRNS